jgi:hypothetical protein
MTRSGASPYGGVTVSVVLILPSLANFPVTASLALLPAFNVEPFTVTVACTREFALIVPRFCGTGVPETVPILTDVKLTFEAGFFPSFASVNNTTILLLTSRFKTLLTMIWALLAVPASTLMFAEALAEL